MSVTLCLCCLGVHKLVPNILTCWSSLNPTVADSIYTIRMELASGGEFADSSALDVYVQLRLSVSHSRQNCCLGRWNLVLKVKTLERTRDERRVTKMVRYYIPVRATRACDTHARSVFAAWTCWEILQINCHHVRIFSCTGAQAMSTETSISMG